MGESCEDKIERAKILSIVIGMLYFMASMFYIMITEFDGRTPGGVEAAIAFSLPIFFRYVWIFLPLAFVVGNAAKRKMINMIMKKEREANACEACIEAYGQK